MIARRVLSWMKTALSWLGMVLTAAVLWVIVCAAGGLGLIVAGVYMLAGLAWACVVAGLALLMVARWILKGATGGS